MAETSRPAAPSNAAASGRFQLYIDEGGGVAIAKGATVSWLGAPPEAVLGANLAHFLAEESQFALSDVLCSAALDEPLQETVLWVRNRRNGLVSGFSVRGAPQNFNDYYRLVFDVQPAMQYAPQAKNTVRGFVGAVARAMADPAEERDDPAAVPAGTPSRPPIDDAGDGRRPTPPQPPEELGLTFVDVGDVDGLQDAHGVHPDAVKGFAETVEERLRRDSVDDAVGRIRPGRFGVVHRRSLDLSAVRADLEGYAREVDPEGKALAVAASTVSLDRRDLEAAAVEDAVEHAVGSFAEDGLDAVIFDTISDSHAAYLDRKHSRTTMIEEALSAQTFSCVYRPIVDPRSLEAAHLLAEFWLDLTDDGLGGSEILHLTADRPDLRRAVDQAICRRLLTDPELDGATVAVDVAIRSMLDQDLVRMLMDFSRRMGRRRLVLRLSGLREIPVERVSALETLRRAGFAVALYGSEIGAVTEERLKRLPIDYILLDPSFVVDIDALRHSAPSLNAMTQRCLKHKVGVVFEGVMEKAAVHILSRIAGGLIAGPYFGEPAPSVAHLGLPVRRA